MTLLDEATRGRPADAEAWYYLGRSHLLLKQNAPAKAALEKAISLAPEAAFVPDARTALGNIK